MSLADVRALARKRPEQEFVLNRLYGAHLSPFLTVVCLRLGLSPDQVTLVGGATGIAGGALLFLPIGWWSVVGVALLQLGYLLDMSDGQVARLTGRSSAAGSYLDWLTHFYVPVLAVLATAASLAWSSGWFPFLVVGALAALELSGFAFAGKEHVLIAMQRLDPGLGGSSPFHAALRDDARPPDVLAAPATPAFAADTSGLPGRAHGVSVRSVIGELLIYPGAVHLLTLAVVIDAILLPGQPFAARALVVTGWATLLVIHVPMAVRRNHALIRAVEGRAGEIAAGASASASAGSAAGAPAGRPTGR